MKLKYILLMLIIGGVTACTQEHLVFVKNISKANLINIQQVLKEGGFLGHNENKIEIPTFLTSTLPVTTTDTTVTVTSSNNETGSKNKPTNQKQFKTKTNYQYNIPKKPKVQTIVKEIPTPANREFSINIAENNKFIALNSIEGDLIYLKDKSNPINGFFLFKSGQSLATALFHIYDLSGNLVKKLIYKIQIIPSETIETSITIETNKPIIQATNQTTAPTAVYSSAEMIIASLANLSVPEKINALMTNINSSLITPADQQILRYKLLDILIERSSFVMAQQQINQITDEHMRYLYTARLHRKKKEYLEALKNYILALGGDDQCRKEAILEMEELLLIEGKVEKSTLNRLETETKFYEETDPDFYARSMINIARLYQFLSDIYTARDILKFIMKGNYSPKLIKLAHLYYEELKRDFLEYE